MAKFSNVVVIGHNRIPFTKVNTHYRELTNLDMLRDVLNGLVVKYDLRSKKIDEVMGGAVIKSSKEGNLIREAVMDSLLNSKTTGIDLQQACATGIQAVYQLAVKIAYGEIKTAIACGVDSASARPLTIPSNLSDAILKYQNEKTRENAAEVLQIISTSNDIKLTSNDEPTTGMSMGEHCELAAQHFGISRQEQDELALRSHKNLYEAYESGFLDDMIQPTNGIERDTLLRPDTTIEKLASLKPAFNKENGTLTAGNSTPFTDGAACVFLASEEWALENNYEILARITFAKTAAIDFTNNPHLLLLAPVQAGHRMLEEADMRLEDFDYYEIHEAFAAQVLSTLKIWEEDSFAKELGLPGALGKVDRTKLNVLGGSLATGHPFAATGCRIVGTMAELLYAQDKGKGFISVCAARGQGVTMIMER